MSNEIEKEFLVDIPKRNYINSYSVARKVVDNAVNVYHSYWELIHRCQEHIKGQKPVPYHTLKAKGLSWVSNENFGKAKSKIEKNVASNITRTSQALALGYVTFRQFEESDKKDDALKFLEDEGLRGICASAVGSAFVSMLLKEHRLSNILNEIEYPAYTFGYCAMVCDNNDDWMYSPVHPMDIAFRPKSKPDDVKTWVIFKTVPAIDLYQKYIEAKKEHASMMESDGDSIPIASSGWSIKGLEAVLFKAFRGTISNNGQDKNPESWAEIMREFASSPQIVIENTQDVSIAKIYHRELDGTISVSYIPYDPNRNPKHDAKKFYSFATASTGDGNAVAELLFFKNFGHCRQEDKLILIRDSGFSETSYIEDYRGIGPTAVRDSIRYNKTRNDMQDKLRFIGSPMFEKPTAASGETFKVTVGHGFSLIPQGFMMEKQPTFDIGSHITMLRFEEGEYNRDIEHYDASLQGRLSSRPNRDEVQAQAREVNQLNTSKDYVKYGDYSMLFFKALKRLAKKYEKEDVGYNGQRRFFDELKKLIPQYAKTDDDVRKILGAIDSYKMEPVLSNTETITIAIQMAETPFARNRFKRMLLLAQGMPIEEININVPLITDKMVHFNDGRIAAFENEDFWTSAEVPVQGTDDHIVHLDSHYRRIERAIEGFQQGVLSPIDAFKYISNAIAHCLPHLELLGRDPALNGRAQEYSQIMNQFIQSRNQIQIAAQRMAEAQARAAEQNSLTPEVQAEIERKNAESLAKQQRQEFLTGVRTDQQYRKIEADKEIGLAKVQAEKEIKLAKINNEPI